MTDTPHADSRPHGDTSARWFRQGLGTLIDALEVALKALEASEPDALSTLRQLAQSLMAPAGRHGFDQVCRAAEAVGAAADAALKPAVRDLIRVLREEAAQARRTSVVVLIIGGNDAFNDQIARRLAAPDREVLAVTTAAEAQIVLREKIVVFIVLNLFLPDLDGRAMIVRLRENPLTAAIPLLVLAQRISEDMRAEGIAGGDIFVQTPANVDEIVTRVLARLRRSHESKKEAHRDSLTGLLNRAAFHEHSARTMEACMASHEPLAFAIVSIDGAANLQAEYGANACDDVTKRTAALLSSSLRATDTLARWGAYEFAAIFPGEDQFGGTQAIEKVRAKLQAAVFSATDNATFQVTFSAGIAPVRENSTVDNVVAEADRFLYQAQAAGGNRVVSDQSQVPRRVERVLLLLDDAISARVLTHLFAREGFEVAHIANAGDGLAATAGRQRFHLIIVDEQLPDRNGFEVLQELRRMPRNNRVPIVMLISRNSPQSIVRALELGANDYVIMPLSPLTFMTHMRRLMKRATPFETQSRRFRRILVVDDEVRPLLLAASALHERGGFQAFLAKGAGDALQCLEQHRPDVVLMANVLAPVNEKLALPLLLDASKALRCKFILASDHIQEPLSPELNEVIAGVVQRPFNALKLGEDIEKILGITQNAFRPLRAIEHLNTEIQRVLRMK